MLPNCEHEDCNEVLELAEACSGLRFNRTAILAQVGRAKSVPGDFAEFKSKSVSGDWYRSRSWSKNGSRSWSWSWSWSKARFNLY